MTETQLAGARFEVDGAGVGRRIFSGVEHGDVDIPAQLLLDGDKIDLYEGVIDRGLFRITGKGARLSLQAGNAIGYLPLNDRVALEVNSRVPIGNLERILCYVDGYNPRILDFERGYGAALELPASILDVMADALLGAVEALREEGLFKSYQQVVSTGSPSGRVLPLRSAVAQLKRGAPVAVSARYERGVNNEINQHIKAALVLLNEVYLTSREKPGLRKRRARLSQAIAMFDGVLPSRPHFENISVREPNRLPLTRPNLERATELSSLILKQSGLQMRSGGGPVRASSILIEMEDVFERYVRAFLQTQTAALGGLEVLDGNLAPPAGGAGFLFDRVLSVHGNSRATPDTLIKQDGANCGIIETKYKVCRGLPARDDLNQAVTYGHSFQCPNVILTYPSYDNDCGIYPLGEVNGVTVYKGTVALGVGAMLEVERKFATLLVGLLASGPAL